MSRLERALVSIVTFLDRHEIPYMVIGGIANVVWGIPRTTLDVELTIWVDEQRLSQLAEMMIQTFSSRVEHAAAFVNETRVLPLTTAEGVDVDVIFGQLLYEQQAIQRATRHAIQGVEVRVCRPEDLVIHKLVSEPPKDRDDVRGLLQQQAGRLDRAYLDAHVAELARALDRPDIRVV